MPKLTERDRLAELEERQRKAAEDVANARRVLRGKYADAVRDLPVERLTERDLREIVTQAIRTGGEAAVTALKALPDAGREAPSRPRSPNKRETDERRPNDPLPLPQPQIGAATDPLTGP